MSEKPIVALVADELGNVTVRAAGDVTVVWVSEHTPHDRVYEMRSRENPMRLADYLGDRDLWGYDGDETHSRLDLRMRGASLKLVPK